MEWTEDAINRLRALWAEGHSTAEIGRRMGVSKNAVVGKAHRLNLASRPSPIRRDGEKAPRRRQARRAQGSTLPALAASLPPMPVVEPPRLVTRIAERSFSDRGFAERPMPVLRAVPAPRLTGRVTAVLLADRRTRHPQFPLLRRGLDGQQAVLRDPCGAGLREGQGPA